MNVNVPTDAEVTAEAIDVLLAHMPVSKVVRALSVWRVGQGDYLAARDQLFQGETLESLFEAAKKISQGPDSSAH